MHQLRGRGVFLTLEQITVWIRELQISEDPGIPASITCVRCCFTLAWEVKHREIFGIFRRLTVQSSKTKFLWGSIWLAFYKEVSNSVIDYKWLDIVELLIDYRTFFLAYYN